MDREFYEQEQEYKKRQCIQQDNEAYTAKQRIKKKAKISVETAVIGALADIEDMLGYLWKHGKRYESLNEEEREMREIWLDLRDSILDRGNNSKQILLKEIDRCVFKGYEPVKYTAIIKDREDENDR